MSVVLHPANRFTVVRQIANHLDTDTNYVRAVIRNAYTDEIIETLNLTDKGSQRFKADWLVPADPSGQGFYISIVTSVYSDSGYTTKNPNYGDEENTYLIEDRKFNGGGGSGIDARTLRRILEDELDKRKPEKVKIPEAPKMPTMRFDEVLKAISGLDKAIRDSKPEKVDMTPVVSALGEVIRMVREKDVTPETDLAPVTALLDVIKDEIAINHSEVRDTIAEKIDGLREELPTIVTKNMDEAMEGMNLSMPMQMSFNRSKKRRSDEDEDEPIDLDGLAS